MRLRNWILSFIIAIGTVFFVYKITVNPTVSSYIFALGLSSMFITSANIMMESLIDIYDIRSSERMYQNKTTKIITKSDLRREIKRIVQLNNELIVHEACDNEYKEIKRSLNYLLDLISKI